MTALLSSTRFINFASKQLHRRIVPQRNLDLWQTLKSLEDIVGGMLHAVGSLGFFCYSLKENVFLH